METRRRKNTYQRANTLFYIERNTRRYRPDLACIGRGRITWFTDKVGQTLFRPTAVTALPFSHVADSFVSELTTSPSGVGTMYLRAYILPSLGGTNEQWITSGVECVQYMMQLITNRKGPRYVMSSDRQAVEDCVPCSGSGSGGTTW